MAPRRIILDCDPGIDDAIAILLAVASTEEIELAAVTCVAGNVPLPDTERNARRVLTLAGRTDIPVAAGCARPLMAAAGPTAAVHGRDGLGGVGLPEPGFACVDAHAVDLIVDTVMAAPPGGITFCPIGPLTNIAVALVKQPAIAERVAEVVLMGGACFRPGNVTATAEFNFHVDPHAAEIVLASGIPATMFPLDVTLQVKVTEERLARLRERGGAVARTAAELMSVYGSGDTALHDPCVIAHLIDPTLFDGVQAHVGVECAAPATAGQSIARVRPAHLEGRTPNARIMTEAEPERVFALLTERLASL
ncbi:MAG: nucleoside hydrolase [Alphaproteobacteria bacterium]|jgi:purine nucleosidase|nr:nucleoside hydrolase [Alphaproteobacteria bacterium]